MAHKLLQLDKKTWEALKKSHSMKKKGKLEAFFTKLTGINVGDHIEKFRKAFAAATQQPTTTTVTAVFKAAQSLEGALNKYASHKEFKSPDAKEFQKDVLAWASEAKDYANLFAVEFKRHEKALAQKEAQVMVDALQKNGLF